MTVKEIFDTMEYGTAPESDKNAIEFLDKHSRTFGLYIDGKWINKTETFASVNPANGEILAQIAEASADDVDAAVKAAQTALSEWVKIGGHERAKYLYAIARQVQKHSRLFAVLESLDNGKPIRETRDIDIPLVARHFYHHAGWAQLMNSEFKDYKEIGVIGQIIPWNFPLLMLSWKIAPALAMGNTVVLKPAEQTSLTALLFAEICQNIGLPKGVVNIITGHGSVGEALTKHPEVQKIAFTGSTEVGKIIRKNIAGSGKKISLELGGKSPFVVFEDADLDSVVEGVVDAIWFNQGQVCCAGSRLLVQESVSEKLYTKLKARLQKLVVGNPLDKGIDMGAVVSQEQLKTISSYVEKGKAEGNEIWQLENMPTNGCFFPPTLFLNVAPSAIIAQEEIFGPVLVAMTFRSHQEAIKLANNTKYGLAASLWTENINLALDVAPKIKAGTIWINTTNVFDAASGFGGYRESGFGREGGLEGLMEYVKPKDEKAFSDKSFGFKVSKSTKITESPLIDRTPKMYIGGKQARPDSGYSLNVQNPSGQIVGEVGEGSRKDIRNAVEAAQGNTKWAENTGHARAQVIYYIAENLSARRKEFENRLIDTCGYSSKDAESEVNAAIDRIFTYAAYADKYDGRVHNTTSRNVTLAMNEAVGVIGMVCPEEFPLLGFIGSVIPAIALGNNVVVIPSETSPLLATDFYQILDTSDVPGGTVNIITGPKDALANEIAKHYDVEGIWYFGTEDGSRNIEALSSESMKRSWVSYGRHYDWLNNPLEKEFLKHATEIKNIWIPYGA
jgi:aldehyde dehydrogenase (NAD+)